MTTGMNLWDAEVWSFIITLSLLFMAMFVANSLRRTNKFIRRLIIPSSVVGGFIRLIANFLCKEFLNFPLYSTSTLEILTYHGLGLGFAALSLRKSEAKKDKTARREAFNTGVTVVNGYLLQAVSGLAITIALYYLIGSFYASGVLLPMGFGQGPGQAYNWGHNYEVGSWPAPFTGGFVHGTSFGLAVAAMGFVSASVGGIYYLNRLKRKGIFKGQLGENVEEKLTLDTFTGDDEIPLAESLDKFTIQLGLVFVAYILAYAVMAGINKILDPTGEGATGLANTIQGMIWGFQFLFSSVCAMAIKAGMRGLKKAGLMHREYTNDFLQDRISGFMFDMMVVASIAAIDLHAFTQPEFLIPLSLICIVGAFGTYFYLHFVCKYIFPDYEHESFLALYGMQTGTASTGVILLREFDPHFETLAADNIVYHMPWAILFGAPMFLMVGMAPKSLGHSFFVMGACAALFVIFNFILFRKQLRERKAAKK